MKRIVIVAAVAAAAALGGLTGSANAGVVVGAGPNGIYVGSSHHRYHHWRRDYDYDYARCRTIVTTRWHHGRHVTVRRRICD